MHLASVLNCKLAAAMRDPHRKLQTLESHCKFQKQLADGSFVNLGRIEFVVFVAHLFFLVVVSGGCRRAREGLVVGGSRRSRGAAVSRLVVRRGGGGVKRGIIRIPLLIRFVAGIQMFVQMAGNGNVQILCVDQLDDGAKGMFLRCGLLVQRVAKRGVVNEDVLQLELFVFQPRVRERHFIVKLLGESNEEHGGFFVCLRPIRHVS